VTCDEGTKTRSRACNSPAPDTGGEDCEGGDTETETCVQEECPSTSVEIPPECGVSTGIRQTRIVAGVDALQGSFPWQAALGYRDPSSGNIDYLCGATLVTKRHVVTAAHCLRDDLETVLLGEHIIGNDTDGANPEEFRVLKQIPHEDYNARTFDNDIAVVTFDTDVVFKSDIQPVCLPSNTPDLVNDKFEKTGVYITGWGAVRFRGPTASTLQQGLIQTVSQEYCQEKFKQFKNVKIDDTKICARDLQDKIDACQGDSGGPMVTDITGSDRKKRYYLIGVVSFGYRCAVPGFPGVYSRVTEYDEWIRNTIANDDLK